ncbi:MAG: hypothetical protein V3S02_04520 [Dehalococcoidales bacterium]
MDATRLGLGIAGAGTLINTVGAVLAHVITEIALHVGQIAYLRGAQRGLEPPPERPTRRP